ncbi:exosporium leader peptide-containing protein [Bacillus cereus]|uniref:exosporium leader peptide-containing protein n=1 Tax=Bacillus cereus TaxID=1396 RepID=UPI003D98930D
MLDPDLVGPTLPPIPSFTLPTGLTGPTGPVIVGTFFRTSGLGSVVVPNNGLYPFLTMEESVLGSFSLAGDSITINVSGTYLIDGYVQLQADSNSGNARLFNNGVAITQNITNKARPDANSVFLGFHFLNAGDVITLVALNSTGGVTLDGVSINNLNFFQTYLRLTLL